MMQRLRNLWNPYPRLKWPFLWKLMALPIRYLPGRQCAESFRVARRLMREYDTLASEAKEEYQERILET